MHWNILDQARLDVLPLLSELKRYGLYLAGGTALALHLGHRDSIDFDFFTEKELDTSALFTSLEALPFEGGIVKTQEERNTLSIVVGGSIRLSFMTYSYPLLQPTLHTEYFPIASIIDIGCMKCSAITSRAIMKDYVDLYFILHSMPLSVLLDKCKQKFPSLDTNLIAKSLVYFDDVTCERIVYKENHAVAFEDVQTFLRAQVAGYIA